MPSKKCSKGEILRVGYTRKAYSRKSRKGSKKVHVSRTKVPAVCIVDRGQPGKGPYTLPKFNKELSLRKQGYSVHKKDQSRHHALEKAAKKYGALKVLRHLNLARNYQVVPSAKSVLAADVKFMSAYYAKHGRHMSRSKHSRHSRK